MAKERKRLINEDLVQDVTTTGHSGQPGRDNPGQDRDRIQTVPLRGNQIVVDVNRPDLLN